MTILIHVQEYTDTAYADTDTVYDSTHTVYDNTDTLYDNTVNWSPDSYQTIQDTSQREHW